ncbi:MAG: BNR-repeat neuraminidase N-terminal domain-containing protein, partial [Bacteroidota bacterium]
MNRFFQLGITVLSMAVAISMPSTKVFGQTIANYNFSAATNGSLEDLSTGSTQYLSVAVHDDDAGLVTDIGFDFYFMGQKYNYFSANSNGQLRLHNIPTATAILGANITAHASGTITIAPFGGDNEVGQGMRYRIIGSAPNRKLVVEWTQFYVNFADITNGGNMQLWLNESTGAINFVYGDIYNSNTASQTRGIFWSSSNTATTAGSVTIGNPSTWATSTTVVSNTIAANTGTGAGAPAAPLIANIGSAANGSRTIFSWLPVQTVPGTPTTLSFTAVTGVATTVNWVDNSTNEVSFIVTRATDAGFTQNVVNTTVATTTAAGTGTAYTSAQTGLAAGTTYFYKVVALSEAIPSVALSGSQATNAAGNITSTGTGGNWSSGATWVGGTVPVATDNVIIADGATVTIDNTSATCNNLTVGQGTSGTLTWVGGATAATLSVIADLTVAVNGTFNTGAGTGTKQLNIGGTATTSQSGNLTVNGTFDMNTSATVFVSTTFFGALSGTISGTGTTCDFYTITVNKGTSAASILELTRVITQFTPTVAGSRLVLTNGTFKISSATVITPYFGAQTICASTARLWLNNAGASVQCVGTGTSATGAGNPTVSGTLQIDNGTFGYGQGSNTMTFTSGTGVLNMSGGTLNIFGSISFPSDVNTRFFMSGGNINVDAQNIANSTTTSFTIGASTMVNWSAGTITIIDPHAASGSTAWSASSGGNKSVTGGTLRIGDGTSTTTGGTLGNTSGFGITSSMGIWNLEINNRTDAFTSRMARITGSTTVLNTIDIKSNAYLFNGSGTTANTIIFNGSSFINAGTFAGCEPGGTQTIGTTQFSAAAVAQTISGAGNFTNLGSLSISTAGSGVSLTQTNQYNCLRVNMFRGNVINANKITLGFGAATATTIQYGQANGTVVAGSFDAAPNFNAGTGGHTILYLQETAARTSGLEIPATRSILSTTINNTNGVVLSGGPLTLTSTLTLTAGILTTTSANLLTVGGTTTGSISGGSATTYINGPVARTLPASLATGSTYTFPVGKSGYNPFELVNPTTNAGGTVVIQAEVFNGNSGGTPGTLMGTINTSRYWAAGINSGAGNFTNTLIKLNDTRGTQDGLANSTTQTGAYNHIGGVLSTLTATAITSTAPAETTVTGFYLMGNVAAASVSNLNISPSGVQCTNVARSVTALVTPGGAAVTGVVINYSINSVAQTPIAMTNQTGNGGLNADTWIGTIPTVTPANANVTWSVTSTDANSLTNSATGTAYSDEPLTGVTASAVASINPVCFGSPVTLTASLGKAGTVNLGTGASTVGGDYNAPFYSNWSNKHMQIMMRASELSTLGLLAGNITQLTFYTTVIDTDPLVNFSIKMTQTSNTDMSAFVMTGLTEVYSTASYVQVMNANTFALTTPFNWDGSSNVVVDICFGAPSSSLTITSTATADATSFVSVIKTFTSAATSSAVACPNLTTGLSTYSVRPRITLIGNAASAITSVSWSDGVNPPLVGNPLIINPTVNATYTATITAAGCTIVAPGVPVIVNPLPATPANNTTSPQCGLPTFAITTGVASPIVKWYTASTGGSPVSTSSSLSYVYTGFTGGGATNTLYATVTDANGCESERLPVGVIVNDPPTLTISPTGVQNVCSNNIVPINVTSIVGDFSNYIWSPATNLYTNAGATIAYDGVSSATTIYYKRSTATASEVITLTASGSGCTSTQAVNFTVTVTPVVTAVTASSPVCGGGNVALTGASILPATGSATVGATGTGSTTSGISMFSGTWGGIKTQYIIRKSELDAAGIFPGTITSLAFQTGGTAGQQYTGFGVSIGHTTQTEMTTTLIDGLTPVYAGTAANNGFTPASSALNTLVFGTGGTTSSFDWNGVDNIVISFCFSTVTGEETSSTTSILSNATGFVCSGYGKSDATLPQDFCPLISPDDFGTGGTASSRPRFTFGGQVATNLTSNYTWSWTTTLGAPAITNGSTSSHVPANTGISVVTGTYTATASLNGCSGSLTSSVVTVNPKPVTPTNNAVTPQCGQPTYSVSTAQPSPIVKWYSAPTAGTLLFTGAVGVLTYSPVTFTGGGATNTVYASITNAAGCESDRTVVAVIVNDPPALAITPTGAQNACENVITPISVTAGTVGNYSNYIWSPATNLYTDAAATLAYDGVSSATPIYYRRSTATASEVITVSATGGGCAATTTVNFTVLANPVITSATATPAAVCAGNAVNLAGSISSAVTINGARPAPTATSNTTPSSYGLVFDVTSEFVLNSVDVYNASSAGTMVIQLQSNAGTPIQTSSTFNVPVGTGTTAYTAALGWTIPVGTGYRLLVTSGTASMVRESALGGFPYALGTAGSITSGYISGTSTTYYYLYNWSITVGSDITGSYAWTWTTTLPGAAISSGSNVSHSPVNAGATPLTGTYTATATQNGCSGSLTSSAVTVNPIPSAPNQTPSTQCGPGAPTASVSDPNGIVSPVFTWYDLAAGGTALQTSTSTTYTTSINATTTFYVSVKNAAGCESGRTAVVATVTNGDVVTANADASATPDTVCLTDIVPLSAVQAGSNNAYTFTWTANPQVGSGIPAGGTVGQNINVTPTAQGTYVYTVTASDGLCTAISTISVMVDHVVILATAIPSTVCAGANVNLTGVTTSVVPGTATVGAGALNSTTYHNPFYGLFSNIHTQHIIPAAELTAAGLYPGNITSVSMDASVANTAALLDVAIKIGTTNATDASSFIPNGSFSTVYTNASLQTVVGINTYTFSTPFNWDGTSNIVLDFCYGNPSSTTTNTSVVKLDNTSYVSSNYSRSTSAIDGATACASTTPLTGTYSARPQFAFAGQTFGSGPGTYNWVWNPGALAGNNITVNPTVSTPYSVTATNPVTGCSATANTPVTVVPALSGTYTVGTTGNYSNLTTAINAYNSICIGGPVTFELQSDYSSALESFPITIHANSAASAVNTLTIKPAVNGLNISGSSATAIIVLNGADYVTIDGSVSATGNAVCPASSASRDLTITNTNTSATSAVLWLQTSPSTDSATNNTIKNINIVGNSNTTTLVGIGSGGSTINASGSLGTRNKNNSIINNNITKTKYGIYSAGASVTNRNTGTVISQNVMNGSGANAIGTGAILIVNDSGTVVTGNIIGNMSSTGDKFGISLGASAFNVYNPGVADAVVSATVTNNIISSLNTTADNSAFGILQAPATTGTTLIANNSIAAITGGATPSDFNAGIYIGGGTGSTTNIYHNSVSMASAVIASETRTTPSFALFIGGSDPIVNIRNNALANTALSTGGTNGNTFAIGLAYTAYTNLTSNYNDLYVGTGATFFVGGTGALPAPTTQATLANWQTTTGKDANSIGTNPQFSSATYLAPAAGSPLLGTATSVGITNDVICATRSVTTPSIGAYEGPAPACIAPVAPTGPINTVPATTSISGSFGASSPAADYYLVLQTTGAATPPSVAPVTGTVYSAGGTLGNATVVAVLTAPTLSFASTNLLPNQSYTFTVYSYNYNFCSGGPVYTASPLSGTQSTLPAQNIFSVASGSWKNPATWNVGYVPTRYDFVTISPTHTVTIDTTAFDSTLLIAQSAILQFDATTAYTLTSGSNVTINGPGIFRSALTGTITAHNLIVYGDLTVNGGGGGSVLDFSTNNNTAGANLIFRGATNNTYTANGNTNDLRTLTIDKGIDITSTLEITNSGFTVQGTAAPVTTADSTAHGFLTLTNGQLKISTATSPTVSRLFSTASYTIPATAGLWLNSAALTVQGMSGSSPTVNGSLRITAGTLNVGRVTDNSLGAGTNAIFNIEGGALNVAGRFTSTNNVNYTQSGGVVTVNTVGNNSSSVPSFGFTSTAVGNSFTMSGGVIVLQKASTAGTPFDYQNHSGTVNITGGAVQFGSATSTAASTFVLTNNATTSTIVTPPVAVGVVGVAQTLSVAGTTGTGSAMIYGGLTVNTGSSLVHNNTGGQQIRVTGNVVNNGTIAQGAAASAGNRFFFDSTGAARTYTGTGTFGSNTTPYPGISITNPNGVDLSGATNNIITGRINLFTGAVTGGTKVTLGNAGTSSVFVQRGGIVYANAGTIDVAPVNNAGTGGFGVIYSPALNAVTSAVEIPTSRTLKLFQTSNTNNVTLAGGNVATDSLVLGGGNIITDASNFITVTGTNTNKVTRTSGWVHGPLRITLASGSTAGNYQLPIGKTTYAGFELLSPVTSASGIIEAELTEGATNGFPGLQMVSLNEQGYWHATDLSTILTSTRIRVTSPVALNAGTDALAQSNDATLTGTYDYVGSSSPNVPTGTISSDPTPLVTSLGYFTLGTKGIPMVYDSATTFQTAGTVNITAGVSNQQLIGVRIHTSNNNPPMTLNSMTFNLQGSVALSRLDNNVSAVRLFSTGNSNIFATTTQVGNQVEPPFTAPYEFTISDAIALLPGTNYFWLAVDVPGSATLLDTLDARCTSINITDNNTFNTFDSIPRVTNPAGNKVIKTILNGDYSIGTGNISGEAGHYATLTAAFAVLNDVGVTGPVRFILTDTAYTTVTGETFPLTINAFTGASSTNRLTIKPNTGVDAAIRGTTGTTTNTALVILNGADYVTIDGSFSLTANTVCPASSASRNLTITNLGTSTSSAVVWLRASATDSATNNIVQNCNIVGNSNTTTLIGVGAGSATVSLTTLATRANINNSYINNSISKTQNGIVTQGVSAARKTSGTVISQNLINTVAPNNVQKGAILVGFDNGTVISGNKIAGMTAADCYGISLGTSSITATTLTGNEVTNATISNNIINNLLTTTTSSSVGIIVMSAATGTNTISNNMISGLNSLGTGGDITAGIFIGGGAGTTNIYYNTVSLTGDRGSTATTLYPSYALAIGGSNPIVNVRNNILYNTQTSNSTSTNFRSYAIAAGYTTFTNLTSNNNDLFVSGANSVLGLRGSLVPASGGTGVATLAAWQTNPGKDLNSKNVAPVFIAADDLHLLGTNASNTTNLVSGGASVSVITDIDCETRATLSTIGADELIPCTGAIGGTLTPPATTTFCASSTVGLAITASGYSTPLNGSYQWQSSLTPGFETPVDIAGATNAATYTISPVVTVTTYYRLKARCSTSADSAYSNTVTITINAAPTATIAAQGGITVFCTPIPGSVTLNGSTNLSSPTPVYQWQLNGADISGANSATYSVPSLQAGNYTLKVTNTATTCVGTSAITAVSTSARPGTISFTPSAPAICAGQNVSITASGGLIGGSGSVAVGAGASTISGTTTGFGNPYNYWYGGQKTQIIYTKAELNAVGITAGNISAIATQITALGSPALVMNSFTINMGHTTQTAATTTLITSGLTPVYSNASQSVSTGVNTYTFGSPFAWNGLDNVVISISWSNANSGGSGSSATVAGDNASFTSTSILYADGTTAASLLAASSNTSTGIGTTNNLNTTVQRPKITFTYSTTAAPVWSWAASPDLNTPSGATVIATPAATSGTVNYTATATSPAGCTTNGIITLTVNPLPTITADSASFRTRLAAAQTTTLPYTATQSPTTYSIVWDAAALAEGFVNVTDAAIPTSPITINIPGNVNAATYTGNISVINANTCQSVSDAFTLIIANGNPVWTGNTNTDWNTGSNWSTGLVPATGVNVTIDRVTANNPVLATSVTIGQLDIAPNNTV